MITLPIDDDLYEDVKAQEEFVTSLLDVDKFRAYLESEPQDRMFNGASLRFCPLAQFVQEVAKLPDVLVDIRKVIGDGFSVTLPQWARIFSANAGPLSRDAALLLLATVVEDLRKVG